jgi:hypothetical protein
VPLLNSWSEEVAGQTAGQTLPISPPYPEIKVWHLVYHLAPFKKNKITLHHHLGQLRKHYSLFNGRKILSCMTGDAFLPLSYIRGYLPDAASWEIVDAPNNPLQEATSIVRVFDDLLRDADDQAFMYAHGKGMSRPPEAWTKWIERLYEYTFGSFARVNSLLTGYPIAGPFLWVDWPGQQKPNGHWFYPGTFFAARCDVLSKMAWRTRPVESPGWLEELPGYLFDKKYLGNVSNAIFGDTRNVQAAEVSPDALAIPLPAPPPISPVLSWAEIRACQDVFWARFDAALAGCRYFDAETKFDMNLWNTGIQS